jgi:hypothetical protein
MHNPIQINFRMNEEVKFKEGHPFAGTQGIISNPQTSDGFVCVQLPSQHFVLVFPDAIELLPIAQQRREKHC